jgi:hypothetical protein
MSYTISIKEVTEIPAFSKGSSTKQKKIPLFGCELTLVSDFPNQKLSVLKQEKVTMVYLKFSGEMKALIEIGASSFEITACGEFLYTTHDVKAIPDILEYGADNHVLSLIKDYLCDVFICGLKTVSPVGTVPQN